MFIHTLRILFLKIISSSFINLELSGLEKITPKIEPPNHLKQYMASAAFPYTKVTRKAAQFRAKINLPYRHS